MKKLRTALGLIALCVLVPNALTAGSALWAPQDLTVSQLSGNCARFCRDVCIANGEPCCILDPNTCGCC